MYLSEVQLFSFQLRYSSIAEAKNALNFLNYFNLLYMPLALFLFCQKSFMQNQSGFQKPKTVVSHITGKWRIAFVGSRIRVAHQFPLVLLTSKLRWSHICSAPQPTTTSRSSNHDIGRVRFELSGVCLDAVFCRVH